MQSILKVVGIKFRIWILRNQFLEADKLLDFILTKVGYKGTLGEKLKAAGSLFSDINGVWRAHKKRNILAHELEANISKKEAEVLLKIFRKSFSDLGIKV